MGFWLRLALIYVILSGGLILVLGLEWRTGVDLLIIAAGFIPAVIRQSPRLFLSWNRLRYVVTNAETTWDLNIRMRGDFDPGHVERFVHRLALEHPGETEVLQSGSLRFLMRYRRLFTVELVLGHGDEHSGEWEVEGSKSKSLDITLFEQQVSYRRSRRVLEDTLIPLVEQIRNEFSPSSTNYSLRVRFDGTNPFFGLYLQHLRPDLVNEFQFEFKLPLSQATDHVSVSKTAMVVTSTSIEGFRQGVRAGLAFQPPSR